MTAPAYPDWIKLGAKVVVYSTGPAGHRSSTRVTEIEKINKKTFKIAGNGSLFDLARQQHHEGGAWGWTAYVVPFDSSRAQAVLQAHQALLRMEWAQAAVRAWGRNPIEEYRVQAIAALQSLAPEEVVRDRQSGATGGRDHSAGVAGGGGPAGDLLRQPQAGPEAITDTQEEGQTT